MIGNGDLARRITEEGLRGITSNPSIFEEAITEGAEYDEEIAQAAAAGRSTAGLYEELITSDVRDACDRLRRLYDSRHHGLVSLEVSPRLASPTTTMRRWRKRGGFGKSSTAPTSS